MSGILKSVVVKVFREDEGGKRRDVLLKATAPALRAIPATQPWLREHKWMWQVLSAWRGDVWQIAVLMGLGVSDLLSPPGGNFFGGFKMSYTNCCLLHPSSSLVRASLNYRLFYSAVAGVTCTS